MFRLALFALVAAVLIATLHAAPEPPKAASSGTRASPAAAPSGAASQATNKPAAAAAAAADAAAQPKSAATPAATPPSAPATSAASTPSSAAASTPSSDYVPLAAGSTEFNLHLQIRGNLAGFDCNSLVSDISSNPAFAGVTRFNLAESGMSDSCAAQVFALLHKMPLVHHVSCHRCKVASAGVAALAKHMSSGKSKISFIDLIWNDLADADIQTLADSFDNVPHFVMVHSDHNPKCGNANGILRDCKNRRAEDKRNEEIHAAARAAEAQARAAEAQAAAAAAAAAAKKQVKADKSAAGTL